MALNQTISVLEELYVVYLIETKAQLTNYDIQRTTQQYYCIRKIPNKCQWQWRKDKQDCEEVPKVVKMSCFLVKRPL